MNKQWKNIGKLLSISNKKTIKINGKWRFGGTKVEARRGTEKVWDTSWHDFLVKSISQMRKTSDDLFSNRNRAQPHGQKALTFSTGHVLSFKGTARLGSIWGRLLGVS